MKWWYGAVHTDEGKRELVMNCKKALLEWMDRFSGRRVGPRRWKPGRRKRKRLSAAKRKRLGRYSGVREWRG
jgi:hypothetical protein